MKKRNKERREGTAFFFCVLTAVNINLHICVKSFP
jgi:hypothetical protein